VSGIKGTQYLTRLVGLCRAWGGGRVKYCVRLILTAGALAPGAAFAQEPALDLPTFAPTSSAVAPFVLQAGDENRSRALRCLTQAVYYEAGLEPREGQEAVAQVVLNRMKHPAFPKSVCGVVYEGSERPTGCQFTFTCDGSLARTPSLERWDAARDVAAAALDGHVASAIGAATHYHAAWMTPYWSSSLVRIQRIGGHVFYRLPGADGAPEALTGQYAGAEPPAPAGLPAVTKIARAGGKHARRTLPPATNGVAQFSVWGIQVATITARHGEVVVRNEE
jgi:hypothetical protein